MFMRRSKSSRWRRLGNFFWPEIGLRRWLKYIRHRIARIPGTPYAIAAGFACGAAVSMTPFVGLHFVLAAIFAWMIGANIVSGLIGTAVGNPWTFPFIWVWIFNLGTWILGGPMPVDGTAPEAATLSTMFGHLVGAGLQFDLDYIFKSAWPIILPMLVGGVPTGIVTWVAFYFPLKRLIARHQRRQIARRIRRKEKRAARIAASGGPSSGRAGEAAE